MAFGQANFALARPMPRFRPFAALVFSLLAAGTARAADRFDIAITVDDLPAHGLLPPGMTRLGIAQTYIAALKAHHVPQAWGFVNGGKIAQDSDGAAVLAAWRKAGYPLGNHTWSHMNAGRASSLAAWEADADRNEPVLRTYMAGENWRMLRFPNLSVGADEARRDGVFAWMKANGYREADVSAAFSDWDYSDAYARCLAKGDQATIARMKAQYLKGVDDGVANLKAVSMRVYGRVIPQVLLTHIGGFSAVMLPEVLDRLDAAGAHYVTLEAAESDPAYAQPGGGSVMSRAARAQGVSLRDIPAPAPASEVKTWCR